MVCRSARAGDCIPRRNSVKLSPMQSGRDTRRAAIAIIAVLAAVVCHARSSRADAIMVTNAMQATTIAEISVARDTITVQLEIGAANLPGFRNILPDAVYEQLGYEARPLSERLRDFFFEDWVVKADGAALPGRVFLLEVRSRVQRDPITGEPLPPGDEDETVLFLGITYALG